MVYSKRILIVGALVLFIISNMAYALCFDELWNSGLNGNVRNDLEHGYQMIGDNLDTLTMECVMKNYLLWINQNNCKQLKLNKNIISINYTKMSLYITYM